MKIKKGFKLRDVCGEKLIVSEGKENIDFSHIINLNESAAYLWDALTGREFTAQDMADLLFERYEVSRETALADSQKTAQDWIEAGLVEA